MAKSRYNVILESLDGNHREIRETNLTQRQAEKLRNVIEIFSMAVASPRCIANDPDCACVKNATHRVVCEVITES